MFNAEEVEILKEIIQERMFLRNAKKIGQSDVAKSIVEFNNSNQAESGQKLSALQTGAGTCPSRSSILSFIPMAIITGLSCAYDAIASIPKIFIS